MALFEAYWWGFSSPLALGFLFVSGLLLKTIPAIHRQILSWRERNHSLHTALRADHAAFRQPPGFSSYPWPLGTALPTMLGDILKTLGDEKSLFRRRGISSL